MIRYILMCVVTGLMACEQRATVDLEKEKQAILGLEAMQREYHVQKKAIEFVSLFSDDYMSINRGIIDKPTKESLYERFSAYFNRVEFIKWDDQTEPVVRFSQDVSVAYVAVDKLVIVKRIIADEPARMDTTKFSWLTIYKKVGGDWKIDCVASTNK